MCSIDNEVLNKADDPTSFVIDLLSEIFKTQERKRFSPTMYEFYRQEFTKATDDGWAEGSGGLSIEEDPLLKEVMRANTVKFSAAKTLKLKKELNDLARTSDNFEDFRDAALKINQDINVNHLRTEYNMAYSTAQSGASYQRAVENADVLPFAIYRTVGDSRVRKSHRALEGKVMRVGSKEHQMLLTPLAVNCRCWHEYSDTAESKPVTSSELRRLMNAADVKKEFQQARTFKGRIFE